jgi:hypothetical protein
MISNKRRAELGNASSYMTACGVGRRRQMRDILKYNQLKDQFKWDNLLLK